MASVLDLASAKAYLNITAGTFDAELQAVIDAAEAALAQHVGALQPTALTDRVEGGDVALVLPTAPVVGLTSVTGVSGSTVTIGDLYVNQGAGVVTYNSGISFAERYYTVVYNAGRATCPDDLLLAVKELVRHIWETQRGSGRPGSRSSEMLSNTLPGFAYTFPFRVSELIAPHLQPGFA